MIEPYSRGDEITRDQFVDLIRIKGRVHFSRDGKCDLQYQWPQGFAMSGPGKSIMCPPNAPYEQVAPQWRAFCTSPGGNIEFNRAFRGST